jgi:chaperonin cofactor prefoldin
MKPRITDEPWFRRAESLIRNYWRRMGQIQRLEARLRRMEERLHGLERDMDDARSVRSMSQALSFVPGSGSGLAPGLDDELERMEARVVELMQRYSELRREILGLRARLANVRAENAAMETVMARLTLEEFRYTEQRYVYRRSNYAIGQALYCSESRARRMRIRVVKQVADCLGLRNGNDRRKNDAQDSA